jgi:hypothetical protein
VHVATMPAPMWWRSPIEWVKVAQDVDSYDDTCRSEASTETSALSPHTTVEGAADLDARGFYKDILGGAVANKGDGPYARG